MNTQTNLTQEEIINNAVEAMVAGFDPKDKAPDSMIATSYGMRKAVMLFNDKTEATKHCELLSKDPEVEVELSVNGYIIYLDVSKNLDSDLTENQRVFAISAMNESAGRALAIVNAVEYIGWADIHGKEADLWFAEKH